MTHSRIHKSRSSISVSIFFFFSFLAKRWFNISSLSLNSYFRKWWCCKHCAGGTTVWHVSLASCIQMRSLQCLLWGKCETPKMLFKSSRHDLLSSQPFPHTEGVVICPEPNGSGFFFVQSQGALRSRCLCMTSTLHTQVSLMIQLVKLAKLAALFWAKYSTVGTLTNKVWHLRQKSQLWKEKKTGNFFCQ